MDKDIFIGKLQEQFIDADEITISMDTSFRELPTWDSLTGMSVLVMIQDEYNVDMTDRDLKSCNTIADIYDFVASKKA
jgi:acyl carrier protein